MPNKRTDDPLPPEETEPVTREPYRVIVRIGGERYSLYLPDTVQELELKAAKVIPIQ